MLLKFQESFLQMEEMADPSNLMLRKDDNLTNHELIVEEVFRCGIFPAKNLRIGNLFEIWGIGKEQLILKAWNSLLKAFAWGKVDEGKEP